MEESQKKGKIGTIIRILGLFAVVVLIIAAITSSMNAKPANSDRVWYEEMTVGNIDAENYFVIYSDIACPYCIAFENAIIENEEAFHNYIESNNILV